MAMASQLMAWRQSQAKAAYSRLLLSAVSILYRKPKCVAYRGKRQQRSVIGNMALAGVMISANVNASMSASYQKRRGIAASWRQWKAAMAALQTCMIVAAASARSVSPVSAVIVSDNIAASHQLRQPSSYQQYLDL